MPTHAERRGAEEAPTSWTGGIESGRGVVSRRICWLILYRNEEISEIFSMRAKEERETREGALASVATSAALEENNLRRKITEVVWLP